MAGSPEAFQSDAFQNDAFQTGVDESGGGAAKFDNLSRGMTVVDEEAWEEEGVILPLTLDSFP
jgi:hypothetical protein